MADLDLTEAIEAGCAAGLATSCEPTDEEMCMGECYDAAVRAAAPIIERAVRERVAEQIARAIEAGKPSTRSFWDAADAARVYAANDFARVARRIGGGLIEVPDA